MKRQSKINKSRFRNDVSRLAKGTKRHELLAPFNPGNFVLSNLLPKNSLVSPTPPPKIEFTDNLEDFFVQEKEVVKTPPPVVVPVSLEVAEEKVELNHLMSLYSERHQYETSELETSIEVTRRLEKEETELADDPIPEHIEIPREFLEAVVPEEQIEEPVLEPLPEVIVEPEPLVSSSTFILPSEYIPETVASTELIVESTPAVVEEPVQEDILSTETMSGPPKVKHRGGRHKKN